MLNIEHIKKEAITAALRCQASTISGALRDRIQCIENTSAGRANAEQAKKSLEDLGVIIQELRYLHGIDSQPTAA